MLKELHLQQVGPTSHVDVEFADRLNIFTGDNGLGKSFLLDVVWWILTGTWADQPAYPQRDREEKPRISYLVNTQGYFILKPRNVWYNRAQLLKNIYSREPNRNSIRVCRTRRPAS